MRERPELLRDESEYENEIEAECETCEKEIDNEGDARDHLYNGHRVHFIDRNPT